MTFSIESALKRIDEMIKMWQESSLQHSEKEQEYLDEGNYELMDTHHSMKVYCNGAVHALEFLKNELQSPTTKI